MSSKDKIKNKQKVSDILNRYKSALKIINDADLARYLKIRPNAVASWRFRGAVDYDMLIENSQNINLHWLFTGVGTHFFTKQEIALDSELLKQVLREVEEVEHQERLNLSPVQKSELILLLLEEVREDSSFMEGLEKRVKRLIYFISKLS